MYTFIQTYILYMSTLQARRSLKARPESLRRLARGIASLK